MKFGVNKRWLVGFGVGALVLVSYLPILTAGFINYDDNKYVTENPRVQAGLTWGNVWWALTTGYAANWHPLTWLSHMLDCQIFGLHPWGHHLTNLLLHVSNTILLFALLRRMTGSLWPSACVAALFGVNPAHVESVAWVAERKDVLSTWFFLLTIWAYWKYTTGTQPGTPSGQDQRGQRAGWTFYFLSLGFFACGLLSKPMVVTLPFVLLLLDIWPLRRWDLGLGYRGIFGLLPDKLPFFLLSLVASFITLIAQGQGGSVVSLANLPLEARCLNAGGSYLSYLGKLLWPENLAVIYPYDPAQLTIKAVAFTPILILVTGLAAKLLRRAPYLLVGWLWFLGTLVPVIGLVQVGEQAMADRYTYIPSIGLLVMLSWGVAGLGCVGARWPRMLAAATSVLIASCAVLTWHQARFWHNSIMLFEHAIASTSNNSTAHATLGAAYDEKGQAAQAARHYEIALQITPQHVLAHNNYGVLLAREGKFADAVAHYRMALETSPNNAEAHFNLANALNPSYVPANVLGPVAEHRCDRAQAAEHYRLALRYDPARSDAHVNWGNMELAQGNYIEAKAHYQAALNTDNKSWLAYFNLANLFTQTGQTNEAVVAFMQAIQCRPENGEAHLRLANLLARQGEYERALPHFRAVVNLEPRRSLGWHNLGGALGKLGQLEEATACLREAVKLDGGNTDARVSLGQILALQGSTNEAVVEYVTAVKLDEKNAEAHRQLALALEREGKQPQALTEFERAAHHKPADATAHFEFGVALAKSGRRKEALAELREALRLQPDSAAALNNLAWILASDPDPALRDGAEAVELARRANELTHDSQPRVLDTLDAAYAEAGRFPEAIATAHKVKAMALAIGEFKLADAVSARLELYAQGKPFHESSLGNSRDSVSE